ncbi:MAG: hypothetical protein Kow00127_14450 [Bacteroidales bacterium]
MLLAVTDIRSQVDSVLKPVQIMPPHPESQLQQSVSDVQLAARFFRDKDYEKAAALYRKLYEENPAGFHYTYYLFCLVNLDWLDDAEKLVREQIKRFPGQLRYEVDLGYVLNEKGETRKATRLFEKLVHKVPAQVSAINELANAFMNRNQPEYAEETYLQGRKLTGYPFFMELGNLYRQTNNFTAMVESWLDQIMYDPNTLRQVQSRLQTKLRDDKDGDLAAYLRQSLLERIQKHPDQFVYSEMLLWTSIQTGDFRLAMLQAKALDKRLQEDGRRVFDLADICLKHQAWDEAEEGFNYLIKKGDKTPYYADARFGLVYTHYLKVTSSPVPDRKDLENLEQSYISTLDEFGRNARTVGMIRQLAHLQAFYLDKPDSATRLLESAMNLRSIHPRDLAAVKTELADVYVLTGNVWEAKLLYGQVEKSFKNDPIGYDAKFRNARLSYYLGEFGWAKSQLIVLKAATSKLIANDALQLSMLIADNMDPDSGYVGLTHFARAELAFYQNNPQKALQELDTVQSFILAHPLDDEVLLKKAEIYLSLNQPDTAISLLNRLLDTYPYEITADNALYKLADIYQHILQDNDTAMKYLERLLADYPGSVFAEDARRRFRILRGDFDRENLTEEEKLLFRLDTETGL